MRRMSDDSAVKAASYTLEQLNIEVMTMGERETHTHYPAHCSSRCLVRLPCLSPSCPDWDPPLYYAIAICFLPTSSTTTSKVNSMARKLQTASQAP